MAVTAFHAVNSGSNPLGDANYWILESGKVQNTLPLLLFSDSFKSPNPSKSGLIQEETGHFPGHRNAVAIRCPVFLLML